MQRLWFVALGLLLLSMAASAQDGGFRNEELKIDPPTSKEMRDFDLMRTGMFPDPAATETMRADEYLKRLETQEAQATLTKVVQWLIYRLTWVNVLEARESSSSEIMEDLLGPARAAGLQVTHGPSKLFPTRDRPGDPEGLIRFERQQAYVQVVAPIVVQACRDVLQHKEPICRINAARILVRLAEMGRAETAEPFIEIITRRDEHNAVRHWASQGLGDLFEQYAAAGAFPNDQGGERFRRALTVLYDWTEGLTKVDQPMDPAEQRAIGFIRRFAVRGLGSAQRPVVAEAQGARTGPVAELLLDIMNNEGSRIKPPATWMERVDAAAALCRLNPRLSTNYQPDFVAAQVGRFIASVGNESVNDRERNRERWGFFALQFKAGMDRLIAATDNTPAGAYVRQVAAQAAPVYELLDAGKNPTSALSLRAWLGRNPPTGQTLFK